MISIGKSLQMLKVYFLNFGSSVLWNILLPTQHKISIEYLISKYLEAQYYKEDGLVDIRIIKFT